MTNWLFFLHFYQPASQQKDILESVVHQSYLPIFKKIAELKNIRLSINISGSLLELFERDKYTELIELIKSAIKEGKVELTGSCKYHALIPLIPEEEIKRQIEQNNQTLSRFLGYECKPRGFFPPEMAYDPKLDPILDEMGFEWIIMDEIAFFHNGNFPSANKIYKLGDTDIKVFFRNRRASNLIMSAVARDTSTLKQALAEDFTQPYLVTGMDGETFGHHRIGFEKFLFELMEDRSLGITSVGNFLDTAKTSSAKDGQKGVPTLLPTEAVHPKPCNWASSIQDIEENIQFLSWNDPTNPIHKEQWEFLDLALGLVQKYPRAMENYEEVRHKMDIALASDHFWWASAKPWWSLEMIEDGAYRLLEVIQTMQNVDEGVIFTGYKHYLNIVSKAAEWQRNGIVRELAMQQNKMLRIPFKDRTFGVGGAEEGVYWAFIDMLKQQEKVAAGDGNYEKAILWRDAIYKLDNKYDIYDAINVIDLLRIEIGNGPVEQTIAKYKEKYNRLRGGQPEQRGR